MRPIAFERETRFSCASAQFRWKLAYTRGTFAISHPAFPVKGCHVWRGRSLLYVGISPRRAPDNGRPASRQRLRNRVRYHFKGNAERSTLRLTLGCLLSDELQIELRRVGSGRRFTFAAGEAKLSQSMSENVEVTWMTCSEHWLVEPEIIRTLASPLNLEHNAKHPFYERLTAIRREHPLRALSLPVLQELR